MAAWLVVLLLSHAARSPATSVEKLLMPGPVAHAHVKQEESCSLCHDRTNRQTQRALCLDCHKDIAADVTQQHGWHGRMANAGVGECRVCHTDHKGREADIVQLNRAAFDHHLTEFPLEGAHAALECASCHRKGEPWRKAPTTCNGCHRADDVHKGQFTQSCADCHSSTTWAGGKFDHETTAFRLTGAHARVTCDACHIGGRYAQTPKTCNGCHATDDAHRGSRGADCAKCHGTQEWKTAKYDHLKETGYALLGVHDRISCPACHRTGNMQDKIPKECAGCHRADDAHSLRFGAKCDDCHDNEKWSVTSYDHSVKHHFALAGAHARLECHACHSAPTAEQKLAKNCAGCHRSEDPHGGGLKGDCAACHAEQSWRSDVVFDHDLTSYPLLGLHRVVSCAQCHTTLAFARSPTTCGECHAHEDVHKGGLGPQCDSCHSTNGWPLWQFDHAKETHFALLGAHARLQCADCHHVPPGTTKTASGTTKTPSSCSSCHAKDDRHVGEYGAHCDQCHSVNSWKGARIR